MNWNQPGIVNGTDFRNVDCDYQSFGFPSNGPQCPTNYGPDYDFGSARNEITYLSGFELKTIIGAAQRGGIYYAPDPDSWPAATCTAFLTTTARSTPALGLRSIRAWSSGRMYTAAWAVLPGNEGL